MQKSERCRCSYLELLIGACEYQLGHIESSIVANEAALAISSDMPEAHVNIGNALFIKGATNLAISHYKIAIKLQPNFADAFANLGIVYLHIGWIPAAIEAYSSAIAICPQKPLLHCSLGDCWKAQGIAEMERAVFCYKSALCIDCKCTIAWVGLGQCAMKRKSYAEAIEYLKEAEQTGPSMETSTGIGICYNELKNPIAAEYFFQKAALVEPSCSFTLANYAGALYGNGKLDEAIAMYRRALSFNPSFPEALNNLGNAYRECDKVEEAISCYTSCIQMQLSALGAMGLHPYHFPNFTAQQTHRLSIAYNNLAGVLKHIGRINQCIVAYEYVSRLLPQEPSAHANLACVYKDAGRHDDAIIAYHFALALNPGYNEAFANLVHSLQCVGDWSQRAELFSSLEGNVNKELDAGALPSVQPFHALSYPFSSNLVLEISKKYALHSLMLAKRMPGALREEYPHPNPSRLTSTRKLRVGYVSSDFGDHPLSHLMGSVFGMHSRHENIEAFCYSLSPDDGSQYFARVAEEADHFLDVSSWSAPAIASRISQDQINIAVNLNGFTKGARNEIFALRPAPIQVSLMGFPATMGANYIDYIVLDKVVCPSTSRKCYSECIAYMPETYFVNDYRHSHKNILHSAASPSRASVGLPEGKVIYSCANQIYKYDPETFKTWCNILRRVPGSVLWLLRFPAAAEVHVRAVAHSHGVHGDRIIFTDVAPKPLHIARSGLADIFLDTPMCNAHTTGCDVLWGGCPIVTLPLERMASRVAASLCTATGLGSEMIVRNLKEYEERAVKLGLDSVERQSLRERLQGARMTCPLFDTERYVTHLESAFRTMWEIHATEKSPRDFDVNSKI